MDNLTTEALNLSGEVEDLLSLDVATMMGMELNSHIDEVKCVKKGFRNVHNQLKMADGEGFARQYPDYQNTLKSLNDRISRAWVRLEELGKQKDELEERKAKSQRDEELKMKNAQREEELKMKNAQREEELKMKNAQQRVQLLSNRTILVDQINWYIDGCDFEKISSANDVYQKLDGFGARLEKFQYLCSDLDICFGEDDHGFKEENRGLVDQIRNLLTQGQQKLFLIEDEKKKIENDKLQHSQDSENARVAAQEEKQRKVVERILDCATDLGKDIEMRSEALLKKLEVDFSILDDFEILELKKQEENLHVELRELIDKVSEFKKFVLPCGEGASPLGVEVTENANKCSSKLDSYVSLLAKMVTDRDISEKKLTNSAGLKMDFKKFSGYDSSMDVYTFKSKFQKLVQPYVQRQLWAEYLKSNCLSGVALNLVFKMEDSTKIWEKLIEVYGDPNLLLQKKLLSLEKLPCLEKLKDDGKIANWISGLLDTMDELSKLAKDYSLENELYYGIGLQKILGLVGTKQRRKFVKLIASDKLVGKAKWDKFMSFMRGQLKESEALILDDKVMQAAGLEKNKGGKDGQGNDGDGKNTDSDKKLSLLGQSDKPAERPPCKLCGKIVDHVLSHDGDKKPFVEYIACKNFVEKTPKERLKLLFNKRFCNKCLTPGVKFNSDHVCSKIYSCTQMFEKDGQERKCERHVLVCADHCTAEPNKEVLKKFKQKIVQGNNKFLEFTKNISFFSVSYTAVQEDPCKNVFELDDENEDTDESIFTFQPIDVGGAELNNFYDSGCGDLIMSNYAVDVLTSLGRCKKIHSGPIVLNGVNNQSSVCEYGAYRVYLPLANGGTAKMSGICVEQVTADFPMYQLEEVENDFRKEIEKIDKNLLARLARLSKEVGGRVDLMIGKHYLKYFPKELARLDSGLTLYESVFLSSNGSRGVIAGPHPKFTVVHRVSNFAQTESYSYYTPAVKTYLDYLGQVGSVPLLGEKLGYLDSDLLESFHVDYCMPRNIPSNDHVIPLFSNGGIECSLGGSVGGGERSDKNAFAYIARRGPKCLKTFEGIEQSGTEVSYRCMECRNCKQCLKSALIDEISIETEMQQDLIEKSVSVDIENNCCSADMPFISDPDSRLVSNHMQAKKVFESQVKKLGNSLKDKNDVMEAEKKLQDLGYVGWLSDLDPDDQKLILDAPVRYFLPWRLAWSNSVSTPCRPVFDASAKTKSGYSLNCILAKGANNMNNLLQIMIRWSIKKFGYHTDVRKMYNTVLMNKEFWRFQLYWWSRSLESGEEPAIKVVKSCIYGIKCSGNQAETALRKVAELMKDEYPMAYDVIMSDIYVDDCVSGEDTEEDRTRVTDELKLTLEKGGFTLKGFIFSGEDPDVNLSRDGKSCTTGGLLYFPKGDFWRLNIGEINFARKSRGRKVETILDIPENLTLTHCAGIAAEVFDPMGRAAPVTGGIKLDISAIHKKGLSWGDVLPDSFRQLWTTNFEMIQELATLEYKRCIIPADAKNLDIVTLDCADASTSLICVAIYARFELKDGTHSCHLLLARTKIVPDGTTTPRAELMAASINAATGYTVQKALGGYHKGHWKYTDSTVALHWLSCEKMSLKTWCRGHVIEINRLTKKEKWRHLEGEKMPADIGTRKGEKVADVSEGSPWINGLPWMYGTEESYPVKTVSEITMSQQDLVEADREKIVVKSFHSHKNTSFDDSFDGQVKLRYNYSKYLVDPNKFRFRKVVRIMAMVLKFLLLKCPKLSKCTIFKHKSPNTLPSVLQNVSDRFIVTNGQDKSMPCNIGSVVEISDEILGYAWNYFVIKTTLEVRKFSDKRKYTNNTVEIDGILYFSGRILPEQGFLGNPELCQAALDLCRTTFCVPVMDQYSPVAISIALETHWYHPDVAHRGVETVHRIIQTTVKILGGFQLAVFIKDGCKRCRILNKNHIEVIMGSIQDVNLCIAPAFYATQVDIFGPFKCYSVANKRATLKVWFAIFCCCTTGAVKICVMDDYSTDSFIMGFIRFSCQFGYPRYLLPDSGSQLVKGCEDMEYSYTDTKQILSVEYNIDFIPCPVGAHYIHGKVERKIREVKKSVEIGVRNERLSVLQWETLMGQISNSINNMPIGLKNRRSNLEQLDLITPNRLILGRNNDRCPNKPLVLCPDHKKMIESNENIFRAWFNVWLVSYIPTLVERPKWHTSDGDIRVGDIVLFLKSEKEFDLQYQYGVVSTIHTGRDGKARKVEVEYQNSSEGVKRKTERGSRELVIIHPVDELDIYKRLYDLYTNCD